MAINNCVCEIDDNEKTRICENTSSIQVMLQTETQARYLVGFEKAFKEGRIKYKGNVSAIGGNWGTLYTLSRFQCCSRLFLKKCMTKTKI